MATLNFETFAEWGSDSFCVQDYKGYLKGRGISIHPLYFDNFKLAGLVLFDDDTPDTIEAFLNMAKAARASIILIEFCNLTDEKKIALMPLFAKNYMRRHLKNYTDLESYETKLSFGLMPEGMSWNKE